MILNLIFEEQNWTFIRPLVKLDLPKIVVQARKRFSNLPQQYGLYYVDQEGDQIDIICEEDMNAFKE